MLQISGYEIQEELYQGHSSIIFRALRKADQQIVILKTTITDHPNLKEIASLQNEFQILKKLEISGLRKAYEIFPHQQRLVLVLEYIPGQPLQDYLAGQPLALMDFFKIVLQLIDILNNLHQQNIIHKDIKPSSIIIDNTSLSLKLVDFGMASQLQEEVSDSTHLNNLEGTLAYMAPEQTGRLNRNIDHRCDFYSLGITFFEMLTAQLPFQAHDPLEWAHCHLAKIPPLASTINNHIPEQISHIIAKLLEKNPEDRYTSAIGLKADLLKCAQQWQAHSTITNFPLGQNDLHYRLHISQKRYGREVQVQKLLDAFDEVAQGENNLVLVSGYSGSGKSSLIREVHKPIVKQRGYFISGKFDQLQRNIPYNAFISAFQELIKQILAEPEDTLSNIRLELLQALGNNGRVISEVIPDIELIIGKSPSLPTLNYTETQQRFNTTFQNFVKVFAKAEHPLVIFLDDLQWADIASLKFIEALLTDIDLSYLLIIGAYRNNEVDQNHPLLIMAQTLQSASVQIRELFLQLFTLDDIKALLADTFNSTLDEVGPLAHLLQEKTHGNPFFLTEFLKKLYQEGLLSFSHDIGKWTWDMPKILALPVTDNVVDLLINKIESMSKATQEIIKLAACVGFSMDLATLSIISKQSPLSTANQLWEAIQANLILPADDAYIGIYTKNNEPELEKNITLSIAKKIGYRFSHDRIQQAAYELIPANAKQQTHLEIVRLLLAEQPLKDYDERLFEIVGHYNKCYQLLDDHQEKLQLAQLNLYAGKRAKNSNAFQQALSFFQIGIHILGDNGWQNNYRLAFDLYKELSECKFLMGQFIEAEHAFNLILTKAETNLDKAKIYNIKIDLYSIMGKHKDSVETALLALKLFGITLPKKPNVYHILKEVLKVRWKIRFGRIEDLLSSLTLMVEPKYLMIDQLLNTLVAAAYFHDKKLLALAMLKSLSMNIKHGYSQYTSSAFIGCGFLLISRFNEFKLGLKLVEIGKKLEQQFNNKIVKAKNHMAIGIFISHWQSHSSYSIEHLQLAYQAGLEGGETNALVYSRSSIPYIIFYSRPLPQIAQDINIILPLLQKLDTDAPYHSALILQNCINYLTTDLENLILDEGKEQAQLITAISQSSNKNYICLAYTFLSRLFYLAGDFQRALKFIREAQQLASYHEGSFNFTQLPIIYVLCLTEVIPNANFKEKLIYWRQLKKLIKQMRDWAAQCPVNFQHNYLLACAEIARLKGHHSLAEDLYDEAINAAQSNGYIFYVALANECAARFYLSLNKNKIGKVYIQEAYYNYQRWGAIGKCKLLEQHYNQFLQAHETHLPNSAGDFHTTTTLSSSYSLDFMALQKSSQAITSEIRLDKLLAKLLQIVVEEAGAQRSVLLAKEAGQWLIEAEGTQDEHRINISDSNRLSERKDLPITLINYVQRTLKPFILQDTNFELTLADAYLQNAQPKSLLILPILYQGQLRRMLYLENNSTANAFTSEHIQSLQFLAAQAAISLENAKFYSASSRFVPHAFLARLKRNSLVDIQLGDKIQRTMSILFCDIQGFTALSESLPVEEIFHLVSGFLGGMEPIISAHQGFIDKYIGDAVMALFDNADEAVHASIAILKYVDEFNKEYTKSGKMPLGLGVGINTGELILGVIGNAKRMDGSVIGDAVNIASRVETLTRQYNVPILITDETKRRLKPSHTFQLRLISNAKLKGKAKPIDLWEVVI